MANRSAASGNPLGDTVWTRLAAEREKQGTPALSRDQIVAAAIDLLDAEGPSGLSMRRLGTALNAGATSLYWHVANKDELLDLVLDEVWGEVARPDVDAAHWRDGVAAFARSFRDAILRHRWLYTVMGLRVNSGPNAMALSEWALQLFESAGFSLADAGFAGSSVSSYVLGCAMGDTAYEDLKSRSGLTGRDLGAAFSEMFADVGDTHPSVGRWMRDQMPADADEIRANVFEFGLERLLDGLAAWLPAPRANGRPRRR